MKKSFIIILSLSLLFIGCSNENTVFENSNKIIVYSRDATSGTRSAFEEIVGFEGKLTLDSIETTGNGDMATKVGRDLYGIGYVSLTTDLEKNGVKALKYNDVKPTVENVLNGSYELSRPFSYVTRQKGDFDSDKKELLVIAFLDYLNNSIEGLETVAAEGGIVDTSKATPWRELSKNHPVLKEDNSDITIKLVGSTSVEKTIVAAFEAFAPMANGLNFEANLTGSGDGWKRVLGSEKDSVNAGDIGFASRDFEAEESVEKAMDTGIYCKDGISVVVNIDNPSVTNLSNDQIKAIFTGEITTWDNIK